MERLAKTNQKTTRSFDELVNISNRNGGRHLGYKKTNTNASRMQFSVPEGRTRRTRSRCAPRTPNRPDNSAEADRQRPGGNRRGRARKMAIIWGNGDEFRRLSRWVLQWDMACLALWLFPLKRRMGGVHLGEAFQVAGLFFFLYVRTPWIVLPPDYAKRNNNAKNNNYNNNNNSNRNRSRNALLKHFRNA